MRRLLMRLALFLTPVAVLAIAGELALRNIPHDFQLKKAYLEQHAGELKVLILGGSHATNGIDPSHLSGPAYNASYPHQTLDFDWQIAARYVPKAKQLEAIVLTASYVSLVARLKPGLWDWLGKDYTLHYGFPARPHAWYDHFEWGGNVQVNLIRLWEYYVQGKSPYRVNRLGFVTKDDQLIDPQDPRHGRAIARGHTDGKFTHWQESLEIMGKLIRLCQKHNVRLILVFPPAWKTYRLAVLPEQLRRHRTTLQALATENSHVSFLDFFDDVDFSEEDFHNPDHLNTRGAQKFTRKINDAMRGL
jgi:hypothetical protein